MFLCPQCGEPVADDAHACPHCGSDAETGWNPDADYLSVELPEEDEPDTPSPKPGPSGAFIVLLLVVAPSEAALGQKSGCQPDMSTLNKAVRKSETVRFGTTSFQASGETLSVSYPE